jgi:hypothetical protein
MVDRIVGGLEKKIKSYHLDEKKAIAIHFSRTRNRKLMLEQRCAINQSNNCS